MRKFTKSLLLMGCTAGILGACAPIQAQRGNMLQDYQIAEVKPGEHTRSDVLQLLGSPTTVAPFDDKTWYYIGQQTEKRGILDPKVKEERIVEVTFDDQGMVTALNDIDNERINIPLERSKTQTHGNEITILQQLLGNLGKFNPETLDSD